MTYNNRSKEYDWFKGQKDPKNHRQNIFKTIWKFTKIFLMFSLVFFSLWGCAQVFTIKTQNHVGDGVEFYETEDDISPYVKKYKADKDVKNNYFLKLEDKNIWLNKFDNSKLLKGLQKQFKSDVSGDNVHKMSDVVNGRNLYSEIKDINGKNLSQDGNVFLAMSSAQKKYMGIKPSGELFKDGSSITQIVQGASANKNKKVKISYHFSKKKNITDIENQRFIYQRTILQKINKIMNSSLTNAKISEKQFVYNLLALNKLGLKEVKEKQKNDTTINYDVYLDNDLLTGTYYKPIVTWNQAWTRGMGPFYGLFVWPIAKISVLITNSMGLMNGWESLISIVIVVFMLRILAFILTFKSVLEQTKQQELQAKKAIIDAKYSSYKGNKQMENRKRQEVSELYKKEGVSPLGALGTVFITMPIFLSIWRVIGGVPHLKSTVWLGINFSKTSYQELLSGSWQYLPLMIIASISAAISQLFPRLLTRKRDKNRINVHQKEAMKKNNKTQNIVLAVYVIMSLIFSAGIQIYWIIGGVWQVFQTILTHHILVQQKKRKKRQKIKI